MRYCHEHDSRVGELCACTYDVHWVPAFYFCTCSTVIRVNKLVTPQAQELRVNAGNEQREIYHISELCLLL